MSDLNIVTLTGRLVRDPIVRYGESGAPWGTCTVASNYHYKDRGGEFKEDVAYVSCKVFGRWAESLVRHKKGDMVIATGRLKTDTWEKEGRSQSQLVVVCDSIRFVVPQNGASTNGHPDPEERAEANGKSGRPPF